MRLRSPALTASVQKKTRVLVHTQRLFYQEPALSIHTDRWCSIPGDVRVFMCSPSTGPRKERSIPSTLYYAAQPSELQKICQPAKIPRWRDLGVAVIWVDGRGGLSSRYSLLFDFYRDLVSVVAIIFMD